MSDQSPTAALFRLVQPTIQSRSDVLALLMPDVRALLAKYPTLTLDGDPFWAPCQVCGQLSSLRPWRWGRQEAMQRSLLICESCHDAAEDWREYVEEYSTGQAVLSIAPITADCQSTPWRSPRIDADCHCGMAQEAPKSMVELDDQGGAVLYKCDYCGRYFVRTIRLPFALAVMDRLRQLTALAKETRYWPASVLSAEPEEILQCRVCGYIMPDDGGMGGEWDAEGFRCLPCYNAEKAATIAQDGLTGSKGDCVAPAGTTQQQKGA